MLLGSARLAAAAEAGGPQAARSAANLAIVATASSSRTSPDTSLRALASERVPANSRDNQHGSYGNWPARGTQWVQYEWNQPVSTRQVEVYWWNDRQGVRLPQSCRLQYWTGSNFVAVADAAGLGVLGDQFNVTHFAEVTTTKLRLEIDGAGEFSTGILAWRVLDSGGSPAFPPVVAAGVDRHVVLGGRTYLRGEARAFRAADGPLRNLWSTESGPGQAVFADPAALETTATFAQPGAYVLKLTATQGQLSTGGTLRLQADPVPEAGRLDVVYTKHYRIDSPLWSGRARALILHWLPHCIEQINRTNLTKGQGGIDNFVEAAKALRGEPHAAHKGYVFANAWVHQTVESICLALMVDPGADTELAQGQAKLRATLEDWIPKILAAQERDGYLQTAYTLSERRRWPERWNPPQRGNHEGYVAGYFIESAINHYTLTEGRDRRLYDAAKHLADCWVANLGPGKKPWYDGHQEMEQALVRFGRFVNDMEGGGHGDAYIRLAQFLIESRAGGSEYDQSHLPVRQQYTAVGHAVRAVYSYSAMADIAAETRDLDYQSAVLSIWDNLVNRKYYVTGGVGSGETAEGFGPDFSLPNNGYCEACSSCGLIFFQYKLNLASRDAKYADLYEETFYNALAGSIDLAGENFYYDNPLVSSTPRYPWHVCPCCVGNIPRTLLMVPTWTYLKGQDSIYVNLFIGGTARVEGVAGTDVEMVQKTDYPWNGRVSLRVNPREAREFSVCLRSPNRRTSALYRPAPEVAGLRSLRVNGAPADYQMVKGYAVLRRSWKPGDQIEFDLPMEPQRITPDDRVAATRGRVALRYGPLIYSVERADQGRIDQAIAADSLKAEWNPDLLGGVTTLKGKWADGSPLTAVPYFSRNNRGPGDSKVWIEAAH